VSEFKRRFDNHKRDILICKKILDREQYWRRILPVSAIRLQVADLALFRMGQGGGSGDALERVVTSRIKSNIEFYSSPEIVEYYAGKEGVTACERYAFDKCARPGDAILDIGVGGGRTTGYLAPNAGRYVGLDYSQEMVVAAQAKYPELQFRCADASDLSFLADGSFDVAVFSFNGIDSIPTDADRSACLREVGRVLRAGGRFVFSSHNARNTGLWPVKSCYSPEPGSVSRSVGPSISNSLPAIIASCLKVPAIRRRAELGLFAVTSKAFYLGHGYIIDPSQGRVIRMFVSTPRYIARELNKAGLELIETLGCHYPDKVPDLLTFYYYYIAVKR